MLIVSHQAPITLALIGTHHGKPNRLRGQARSTAAGRCASDWSIGYRGNHDEAHMAVVVDTLSYYRTPARAALSLRHSPAGVAIA